MNYHLSERPDGRIVLDREPCGFVLQKITAPEPSVIRRQSGNEWVDIPQYYKSFSVARSKVNEMGLISTPEGWFRTEAARDLYVRGRLGEAE